MRLLFALLLWPGIVCAQVAPVDSRTEVKQLISVVKPAKGFRMAKNVIFVLDVSHSMGFRVHEAIQAATSIAKQPVDEMKISVYAFRSTRAFGARSWIRWTGIKERGVPRGWAALPSVIAVAAAESWLTALGASGGTEPAEALANALVQPLRPLSVFLISDGEFPLEPVALAIYRAQKRRVHLGLGRATVIAYGAGKARPATGTMIEIGTAGRGGYWLGSPR